MVCIPTVSYTHLHNLTELEVAHQIGAQIIGINNRNLVTFETDLHTSLELATNFEQEPVYISESAIFTAADARMLAPVSYTHLDVYKRQTLGLWPLVRSTQFTLFQAQQ